MSNISRYTSQGPREKGFTLIELIIVVALIGIVAAIAAPQLLQQMPKMRVNSAARQVLAKMLLLRARAVSENKTYNMVFSPGGNIFKVKQGATTLETATLPPGIVFGSNADKRTDGVGDSCVSSLGVCFANNAVAFTPAGSAKDGAGSPVPPGASVYLIPSEDNGTARTDRMRALAVDSVGKVKTWQYSSGNWTNF